MSSLGFVVLYMLCNPGSSDCVPTSMLLQRFANIEQCHLALPAAEIHSRQTAPGRGLTPVCRDLDDLCKIVVGLYDGRNVWGGSTLLWPTSTGTRPSMNKSIAPHLSIMCQPQRADPGCDG